ncbi:MAG TPA: DUF3037 domain-containing protein [Cyclobacteriaceae bacterium]
MQENHLFEYAVIRVVPRVEREEFLNVGVVVFCNAKKFLKMKFVLNEDRLKTLSATLDIADLRENIRAFERICAGGKDGGSIGMLSIAERFRWLTATRSTVLQTSKVHPGLCEEPEEILERLFKELVV